MPVTRKQFTRLRKAILQLLEQVQNTNQLAVRRTISDLYYQQKARELELVSIYLEQVEQTLGESTLCSFYKEAFYRWRRDVRWLHQFMRKLPVL